MSSNEIEHEAFEDWFPRCPVAGLVAQLSARAAWLACAARKDAEIARLREERDSQQRVCIQVMEEREAYKAQLEAAQKLQPQLEKVFGFARFVIKCFHRNGEYAPLSSQEPHEVTACLDMLEKAEPVPARVAMPELSGVGRDVDYPRAVVLHFSEEPSDENLRDIHEVFRLNGLNTKGGA